MEKSLQTRDQGHIILILNFKKFRRVNPIKKYWVWGFIALSTYWLLLWSGQFTCERRHAYWEPNENTNIEQTKEVRIFYFTSYQGIEIGKMPPNINI